VRAPAPEHPLPLIAHIVDDAQARSFTVIEFTPAEATQLVQAARDWVSHHPRPDEPLLLGDGEPLTPRSIATRLDERGAETFVSKLFDIGLEGDTAATVLNDLANDIADWSTAAAAQSAADQSARDFALLHAGFPSIPPRTPTVDSAMSSAREAIAETLSSNPASEPSVISLDDVQPVGGIWHAGGTVVAADVYVAGEPTEPASDTPHPDTGDTAWHAGA
jgi:hypothetical protein